MMKETLNNIFYIARRFKFATFFNMLGLVLAFSIFYLLMTQISYQYTYNHDLEDHNRLYRLETDLPYEKSSDLVSGILATSMHRVPEIESYSITQNILNGNELYYNLICPKGDSIKIYNYTACNSTGVSALTNKVISGSIKWEKKGISKTSCIIPASIAREHFGTTKVAGKEIIAHFEGHSKIDTVRYPIHGVYEDFPANSELINCIYLYFGDDYFDDYATSFLLKCIVKLKKVPNDVDSLEKSIKRAIIAEFDSIGWDIFTYPEMTQTQKEAAIAQAKNAYKLADIKLIPLSKSYFDGTSFSFGARGFKPILWILILSCLLLIVIAAINFLNFTLAESPMRIRGLNTRHVLGASRQRLRNGILLECVITLVIACLLALVICPILARMPWMMSNMTDGSLYISDHKSLAAFMIVLAVLVGVIAGAYPSTFVTSFTPAMALKGNYGLTPQGKMLRTILVCLQLTASMVLFIYICILLLQSHYIKTSDYGYNKDCVFSTYLPYEYPSEERDSMIREELMLLPEVENVSISNTPLGSIDCHETESGSIGKHTFKYSLMSVDSAYLKTMGIRIVEGRGFLPTDTAVAIINEGARKGILNWVKLGVTNVSISSEESRLNDSARIVGVCENIRFGTTRIDNSQPYLLILDKYSFRDCLNVRVTPNADHEKARQKISNVVKKYAKDYPIRLKSFDDLINKAYKAEFRSFRQMYLITIICILITLIGIFCLMIFETEYRRKEIGIRKVAGATTREIVGMFCRHYGRLLLISIAIAIPVAYFGGDKTLSYFDEHGRVQISEYWWLFPLGILLVGGVTIGVVAVQSWRFARENPVNSIQSE